MSTKMVEFEGTVIQWRVYLAFHVRDKPPRWDGSVKRKHDMPAMIQKHSGYQISKIDWKFDEEGTPSLSIYPDRKSYTHNSEKINFRSDGETKRW